MQTETEQEKVPQLSMMDATEAFAIPGEDSLIDCINPFNGLSWIEGENLEQIRLRYPGAEVVNIEAFCKAKAERQDTPISWTETTREHYEEMLNCLPPADYSKSFTAFLVGEAWDHHAGTGRPRYAAYEIRDGRYWEANRPMMRSEFRRICS